MDRFLIIGCVPVVRHPDTLASMLINPEVRYPFSTQSCKPFQDVCSAIYLTIQRTIRRVYIVVPWPWLVSYKEAIRDEEHHHAPGEVGQQKEDAYVGVALDFTGLGIGTHKRL